jgi:hypothetical protein
MNETFRVVVLYPVLIGVTCGFTTRLLSGWNHGDLTSLVLGLGLSFLVWFPFSLRPYLMKDDEKG